MVMDNSDGFREAVEATFPHQYIEEKSVNTILVFVSESTVDGIFDLLTKSAKLRSKKALKPILTSKIVVNGQWVSPPTPLEIFKSFSVSYWVGNVTDVEHTWFDLFSVNDLRTQSIQDVSVMSIPITATNVSRLLASLYGVFETSKISAATCFLKEKTRTIMDSDVWNSGLSQRYQANGGMVRLVQHSVKSIDVYDETIYHSPDYALLNSSGSSKTRNVLEMVHYGFDVVYVVRRRANEAGYPKMNLFHTLFFDYVQSFKPDDQDSLTQMTFNLLIYTLYSCSLALNGDPNPFCSERYHILIWTNLANFGQQRSAPENINIENTVLKWLVGRNRPLILMLDECHAINDIRHHNIEFVRTLKRALRSLNHRVAQFKEGLQIADKRAGFVLGILADTLSSATELAPSARLDPSKRVNPVENFPLSAQLPEKKLPIFIDIASMGCLSSAVCRNDVSFLLGEELVPTNAGVWKNTILSGSDSFLNDNSPLSVFCLWLLTQGRPLWGTLLLQMSQMPFIERAKSVIMLARHKLTGCDIISLTAVNNPLVSLACAGVRLGLVFEDGQKFTEHLVEGYMAYCTDVDPELEFIQACYVSEPALVEAASAMIWESADSLNIFLSQISQFFTRGAFSRGHAGEIVGRIVSLLARDVLVQNVYPLEPLFLFSRGFTVAQFLTTLYGDQYLIKMNQFFADKYMPKFVEKKKAWEKLLLGVMNFSHFTTLATIPNNGTLSALLNNCSAGFMPLNNTGFDGFYSVLLPDGSKTEILYQIKCRASEYESVTTTMKELNRKTLFKQGEDPSNPGTPYLLLRHNYGYTMAEKPLEVGVSSLEGDDGFYISIHGLNVKNFPFFATNGTLSQSNTLTFLQQLVLAQDPYYTTRPYLDETPAQSLNRLKETNPLAFHAAQLPGLNVLSKFAIKLISRT